MARFWAGIVVVAALGLPATAHAADFSVTTTADTTVGQPCADPAHCSLREAITSANAAAGSDRVLIRAGTYQLADGQLPVTDTVDIERDGPGTVTIDGHGLSRVFLLTAPTTLADLTLTGGQATNSPGGDAIARGGAIYSTDDLTLDTVIVNDNIAYSVAGAEGGGLYSAVSPVVGGSSFTNNLASTTGSSSAHGGAIAIKASSTPKLDTLVVTGNQATSVNGAALGGGIYGAAPGMTVEAATLSDNFATATGTGQAAGAGLFADVPGAGQTTTLIDVWANRGTAESTSGAADGGGVAIGAGRLVIRTSTFSDGKAITHGGAPASGGGIASGGGRVQLVNSTVLGNAARATGAGGASGGGVSFGASSVMQGATIAHNTAANTGGSPLLGTGGGISAPSPADDVLLSGSIVSGNSEGSGTDCGTGTLVSDGGNVVNVSGTCAYTSTPSDVTRTDPGVATGVTFTGSGFAPTALLDPSSPARDRYAPMGAVCNGMDVDERGITRPQGTQCDSGAVEMRAATFTADPASLAFGSVDVGTTSPAQDVAVTNDGDLAGTPALSVTGPDSTSFALTGCTSALASGATCTASLTFSPPATGPAAASLSGAAPTVALSGAGAVPAPPTTPSGGGAPQCADLDVSTAFATGATVQLQCSATVWNWTITTAPQHGALSAIGPTGQLTYTPDDGFSGDDSFGYVAEGGGGQSAPATVVAHVGPGPVTATQSSTAPQATCATRRVTVRLNAHGVHFVRARVSVDGVSVTPRRSGTRWTASFVLKGPPGQKVTVHISGRRSDGGLLQRTRKLTVC